MSSPYIQSIFTYIPKYCEKTPNDAVNFVNSLGHALYVQSAIIQGTHKYAEATTVIETEKGIRKYDLFANNIDEVLDSVINHIMRYIPTHLYPLDHISIIKDVIRDISMHHMTLAEASDKLDAIFVRTTFEQIKTFKTIPGQLDIVFKTIGLVALKSTYMTIDGVTNVNDINFVKQQLWSIPDMNKNMMLVEFDTKASSTDMTLKDESGDYYTFANGHRHSNQYITVTSKTLLPTNIKEYLDRIESAVKAAFDMIGRDIQFIDYNCTPGNYLHGIHFEILDYVDDEDMMMVASYLNQWQIAFGDKYFSDTAFMPPKGEYHV